MGKSEYELLREEILFYIDKHQTVRNMMYVTTGTLLGLVSDTKNAFLYLLPLIVIIPSFITSQDYLDNIHRASTYLKVFYEDSKDSIYHWETRLRKFSDTEKNWQKIHRLPYVTSAMACIALYWFNDKRSIWFKTILAIICLAICGIIFWKSGLDGYTCINKWKTIKEKEK